MAVDKKSGEKVRPVLTGNTLLGKDLVKVIKGKTIVDHVTLSVSSGEVVGLLGPNGAGKTTSFNMMIGLIRNNGGEVYFNNQPVNRKLLQGYLKQIFANRPDKTVYLFADKDIPYGDVLTIMDEVKLAGIDTVGLATAPPEQR